MNKLTEYKRNGFHYKILKRSGDYGLFHGKSKDCETFEVIKIQSHNGRAIYGKTFPPSEFPPSNEQWGSYGWTFTKCKLAEDFFNGKVKM